MSKTIIEVDSRKTLYYNKYQYKANFTLTGFHCASYAKTAKELDRRIANHVKYSKPHGKWLREVSHEILSNRDKLLKFINWQSKNAEHIGIRSESSTCSVFSNDINLLKKLSRFIPGVIFTKVELYGDPEIIDLLDPKHNYRIYLKSRNVKNCNFTLELGDFLELHKKTIFPCRALTQWIKESNDPGSYFITYKSQWISGKYFIEYDDESTRTLLSFFLEGYLGKVYKVVKRES